MAPPVLYSIAGSPPCRGVLLAAAAAGIEIEVRDVSLADKEHLKPEFLKINPQHTVPTLDDNGFYVGDSHAIVTYLVDKYKKDDSLYPEDLQKRTVINQRLHFNNSTLINNMRAICIPIFYKGETEVPQHKLDDLRQSFEFLEKHLGDNEWLAGDNYTLADICTIATVSSLMRFVTLNKFPKLAAWAKRCEQQIPGYATANAPGLKAFHDLFQNLLPHYKPQE